MIWYNFTLPFPANITKDFLENNFFSNSNSDEPIQ